MTDGAVELARGQALMTMGRHHDALPLLVRAAALSPGNPTPWCLQAACHLNLGDPKRALVAAERAVSAAPADPWAHRLRALSLGGLNRTVDAQLAAAEAVRLAPANPTNLRVLAECQAKAGNIAEATRAATRARELAPEDPAAWITLSFVALKNRQPSDAMASAWEALRLDPTNVPALNNLGVAYRLRFQFIRALQSYVQCWRLAPNNHMARRNIAGLLIALCIMTALGTYLLVHMGAPWAAPAVPLGAAVVAWRGLRGLPSPALRIVGHEIVRGPGRLGSQSTRGQTALIVTAPIWAVVAISDMFDLAHRATLRNVPFVEIAFIAVCLLLVALTIRNIRHGNLGWFGRLRR
jgi:Flp pilus assembly protein TadD